MSAKPDPFWIASIAAGGAPRLRNPGESVEDYRVAMGWDKPNSAACGSLPPNDTPDGWLDILQTIELGLKRGYTPAELLDENSPVRDRIRAAARGVRVLPEAGAEAARLAFEQDAKQRDGGEYADVDLRLSRTEGGYINPVWNADWLLWLRSWNAARGVKGDERG